MFSAADLGSPKGKRTLSPDGANKKRRTTDLQQAIAQFRAASDAVLRNLESQGLDRKTCLKVLLERVKTSDIGPESLNSSEVPYVMSVADFDAEGKDHRHVLPILCSWCSFEVLFSLRFVFILSFTFLSLCSVFRTCVLLSMCCYSLCTCAFVARESESNGVQAR
jgi:hypothetical protein